MLKVGNIQKAKEHYCSQEIFKAYKNEYFSSSKDRKKKAFDEKNENNWNYLK